MSPTRRAAWVMAAGALVAVLSPLLAAVWIVGVFGIVAWDAARVRVAPTVRRGVSGLVVRGVPSTLTIAVGGAGASPVDLRQAVPADLVLTPDQAEGAGDGPAGPHLDGVLVARRRGRHRLPPVAVRLTGPLGLGRWTHHAGGTDDVVVYPDVPGALRLARSIRTNQFDAPGGSVRGPFGLGTDLEAVRDYLPDDDIRLVNWPATARLDRPMSNQFRVEQSRSVMLAVDTGRLMAAPLPVGGPGSEGEATRLDLAVDAAVAVGLAADALGDLAGVLAFDERVHRRLEPRHHAGQAIIRAVYDLEPRSVDSDFERAFQGLAAGKRKVVVLWTDLLDEAAARPLLDAMRILARRHAVVVASVVDPVLEQAVSNGWVDRNALYRAAAAADLLAARARTVALIRHTGADVVEARPDALAAASVRAYLRVKARGR